MRRLLLLLAPACLLACPAPPEPEPADAGVDGGVFVCDVVPPATCMEPAPHFADISPVLQQRCVTCHHGNDPLGPWPMKTYEEVADWQDTVRSEVANCTMPPPDAGLYVSNEERVLLLNFIRCGLQR